MGPFCNKKTNCFLSNLTWQTSKDSFPIFPYSQTVRTESVVWRTGTYSFIVYHVQSAATSR